MLSKENFERNINGKPVSLYTLKNGLNTTLYVTNYGCRIAGLQVMDKNNNAVSVVMGYDTIDGYLNTKEVYHGATVGRYANRIAKGRFQLNHHEYELAINNGPNHLHGGPQGFHSKVWDVDEVTDNSITLSYLSPDGEEGYPGNMTVTVTFSLSAQNEVVIAYRAITDKPTVLNLTNHAYFNLNGVGSGNVFEHLVQINANHITPVDENLIPTGILMPVADTPFDFTTAQTIGKRINDNDVQLQRGNGYDHNYVLNGDLHKVGFAAKAIGDKTGIVLETFTDQPGMQLYTGKHTLFCFETQHFPDSPHHSNFPTTVLNPGEAFESTTVYRFS
ncbi:MAG: aldose epimerase family protein [Flavisolibacter sp.]